ncbi:15241_t:CDS:2, partial [Racocetra fulgida]
EYQQVYQWLYSDDPKQNELGVKRAKVWSARGKNPHAVVSTAAFVEVSLRDKTSFGKIYNHEFVNGMVDPTQGSYASSVASLALKLNMPLWFVELRHAGTHEHLPSLQVLRNGCQQALQWLNENYWGIQRPLQSTHMNEIHSLLSKYKELRKKNLKDSEPDDTNSMDKIVKRLLNLVSAEYVRDLLIPVLLEEGFLVPTETKYVNANLHILDLLDLWFAILCKFDSEWTNFGSELVQGMLEKLVMDEEENNPITDSNSESVWKMYDSEKWKACPMGCLPNGQIPCLDLSPDLDEQ